MGIYVIRLIFCVVNLHSIQGMVPGDVKIHEDRDGGSMLPRN